MGNKPAEKNVSGATDDLVKQVSALVVVMVSAPEAPVTATPSTNSKNTFRFPLVALPICDQWESQWQTYTRDCQGLFVALRHLSGLN